jgi:hypothetical protein
MRAHSPRCRRVRCARGNPWFHRSPATAWQLSSQAVVAYARRIEPSSAESIAMTHVNLPPSAVPTAAVVDNRRIRVGASWKLLPAPVADGGRIRVGASWKPFPSV